MSDYNFFNQDWLDLQRKYWDTWTEMSRKAMSFNATPQPTTPWEGAIDHWWQALSPAMPSTNRVFMDRLIEQGKAFFHLVESAAVRSNPNQIVNGLDFWNQIMTDAQKRFTGSLDNGNALNSLMSFWKPPLDTWQRMISSLSPMPGDLLRNLPHEQMKDRLNRALSAPGLGFTREEQGQYQDLMRCGLNYQTALQEYLNFYNNLGIKSIARMGKFIQEVVASGKPIDSARALYDNWVGSCEAVYAEEVATPEYAKIHGQLINAQMALKKRMSIMVDESLGAFNMPTQRELRTVQDRLQETRREHHKLNARLQNLEKQLANLTEDETSPPTALLSSNPPVMRVKRKLSKPSISSPQID